MTNQASRDDIYALQPGDILSGEYEIAAILGSGGFGITYRAVDRSLRHQVAIKEYFPRSVAVRSDEHTVRPRSMQHGDDYQWGLQRFREEAQTLAKFDHPNIVKIKRIFDENNTIYCVLEYISGPSFYSFCVNNAGLINQANLDVICHNFLSALEHIHAHNVLHRDIAPDNILMKTNSEPILIDFGAARVAVTGRSVSMSAIYKRGYSSLEQHSTDGSTQGPWTDIYSFAATLYFAVAGSPPVDAVTRSFSPTIQPATSVGAGRFRPRFLEAIDHGLALAPQDRPRTVADWRAKLLADTPFAGASGAVPAVVPASGGRAVGPRTGARGATSEARRPTSQRPVTTGQRAKMTAGRKLAIALLSLAAAGAAAALYLIASDPGSAPRPSEMPRADQPLAPVEPARPVTPAQPVDDGAAERRRQAEQQAEAERRRQAEQDAEAERLRQAEQQAEAERRRQAEQQAEAERRRQAEQDAEAERRRQAEQQAEAERRRKAAEEAEAERRRKAAAEAEAERRRNAAAEAEAERRRNAAAEAAAERRRNAAAEAAAERRQKAKRREPAPKTASEPKPKPKSSGGGTLVLP